MNVVTRNMKLEYLIPTTEFVEMIPDIKGSVSVIQTNIIPPPYLVLERFEGKSRYKILKEKVDYLFELEMPGAVDYAPIISPNQFFLESVIEKLNCQKTI